MTTIRDDAEGAVNTFLRTLEADDTLVLYDFDSEYREVFKGRKGDYDYYKLEPRGMTALYDAVGRAIDSTGAYLKARIDAGEEAPAVVFVIVTDGGENSSREITWEALTERIKTQTETYGWTFDFLAADQDAMSAAKNLGINNSVSFANTGAGHTHAYATVSTGITNIRGGASYGGGHR